VPKEQIKLRIQELLDELEQVETADPEARQHLESVLSDIRSVVADSNTDADSDGESLRERLEEATRNFEESHPTLTAMVGRVADSLSNLGI
jgi:signal transduction histidine kinase